jgi:hypothetical protein
MGGYLETPDKAPAGSKRLSRLLHCAKWSADLIRHSLWQRASQQPSVWNDAGLDALALWDESVWEKPESFAPQEYGPVRSSKAARLTHIKKGYYTPPRGPIFVPGLHWRAVILVGRDRQPDPPALATMRWWTSRGPRASFKRDEQAKLLLQLAAHWGQKVLHVFDQGEACSFWLGLLLAFQLRFVLRWKKEYQLVDAQGNRRAAWKIARGKRGWQERTGWDCRRHQWVQASMLALPVCHPQYPEQRRWLVIARRKGGLPWYLLSNEPITGAEDAWGIMFAYARRWQIEFTWRENKSELADHQSTPVALGAAGKTPGAGESGLRLSADPALAVVRTLAPLGAPSLLSSHGLALPPSPCAFRASAHGPEPTLARLSSALGEVGWTTPGDRHDHASLKVSEEALVSWMRSPAQSGVPSIPPSHSQCSRPVLSLTSPQRCSHPQLLARFLSLFSHSSNKTSCQQKWTLQLLVSLSPQMDEACISPLQSKKCRLLLHLIPKFWDDSCFSYDILKDSTRILLASIPGQLHQEKNHGRHDIKPERSIRETCRRT